MLLLHVVSHLEKKGEVYIPLMFYLKSCVLCSLHCEISIFPVINLIKSWTVAIYFIYCRSKWDCLSKLELWLLFGVVLENQLLPNLMQH